MKTINQAILDSEIYTVALSKILDYLNMFPNLPKDIKKINMFLFNSQYHFVELPCNFNVSYKLNKIDYDMLKSGEYVTLENNDTTYLLCKHYSFIQMEFVPDTININEMNNHFINNLKKGELITRNRLKEEATAILQCDKSDIKQNSKWQLKKTKQIVSIKSMKFCSGENMLFFVNPLDGTPTCMRERIFRCQYCKLR